MGSGAWQSRARTQVGRADLVRLAVELGRDEQGRAELERAARWMGLEAKPPTPHQESPPPPLEPTPPAPTSSVVPASAKAPPHVLTTEEKTRSMALLRLEEAHFTDAAVLQPPPPEKRQGLTDEDLDATGRSLFSPLKLPPLAPWRRLWPLLRDRLQIVHIRREPDLRAITRTLGRGQILSRIPLLSRSAWTPRLTLWRDNSHRLRPWAADQREVQWALKRVCGKAALRVRFLDDSHAGSPETEPGGRPVRVDLESPILVLGDLGAYGTEHDREGWSRAAERLRRRGAQLFALVAASRERTGSATFAAWNAIAWDRAGLRPRAGFPEDALPKEQDTQREQSRLGEQERLRDERAEALLTLSSAALVVEPGLLRALRRLLPASEADFSTEVAAWNHEHVEARGPSGLVIQQEERERYRARLAALAAESPSLLRKVKEAIADWHRHHPQEIAHAETIGWSAHLHGVVRPEEAETLCLGDMKSAAEFAYRLVNSADAARDGVTRAHLRRACEVFLRSIPEDPQRHADAQVRDALERMRRVTVFNGAESSPPERCGVSIVGRSLVLRPAPESGAWPAHTAGEPGSPISWLPATRGRLRVVRRRGGERAEDWREIERGLRIEVREEEELVLETDQCRLVYRFWAPESWASGAGRDRFGLWADLEVQGVVQRFRWIPPGRFLMGSPEGEAGRRDNEGPQHEVTFTRGYWLADTPCTQALWEVVMGKNPSEFVTPDRPVERVSWNDCQTFIDRLSNLTRDFAYRLPGEAEWEHACRAGTSTATWLGDLDIQGANNAPLLDKIAWYGGNCGVEFDLKEGWNTSGWKEKQFPHEQGGTRRVRQKASSPLGLHDMIGNVYEWCADVSQSYEPQAVINPEPVNPDPEEGGSRVIRGGSWNDDAGDCRAACRRGVDPGDRNGIVGFRLVRGRAPSKEAEPQEAEPQEKGAEPREGARSGPDERDTGRVPFEASSRDAAKPPTKTSKLPASPPNPPSDRRR